MIGMTKLYHKKLTIIFIIVNQDNQHSLNNDKPKILLTNVKKSKFRRTNSNSGQGQKDQSKKIPLSSSTKITEKKENQSSSSSTKLNAMYPSTLLGPVKYSIIKRQVSEPPDISTVQDKPFASSVDFLQKSSNKNDLNQNENFSEIIQKNFLKAKTNKKKYYYPAKKSGRKKKCQNNENEEHKEIEITQQIQEKNDAGNKNENQTGIQKESIKGFDNENKNDRDLSEKKVIFDENQFKQPKNNELMISRTMSAGNPNSNSYVFLDRAVNYLMNKRKLFYGEDQQISRTTSNKISSNLPKTPFEYVTNLPAPILGQNKNRQHSYKLLEYSVKDFSCSHSDDEAHEIYEVVKSKMNLNKNTNSGKGQNDIKRDVLKSEKVDVSDESLKPNEKENESKSKSKAKHFYGESSSSQIMNFLKNRINWNSQENNSKPNKDQFENKTHKSVANDDTVRFVSMPLNKVVVAKQTSAILEKFEKAQSDIIDLSNSISSSSNKENKSEEENEKKEPRQKPFIPPYFRESQNENKIKKVPKKKISNILDIEKLNQMQDVTRQYGIFDEVYRPFTFKKKKKTSSDEFANMLDFNKFDGFFETEEDFELFFN